MKPVYCPWGSVKVSCIFHITKWPPLTGHAAITHVCKQHVCYAAVELLWIINGKDFIPCCTGHGQNSFIQYIMLHMGPFRKAVLWFSRQQSFSVSCHDSYHMCTHAVLSQLDWEPGGQVKTTSSIRPCSLCNTHSRSSSISDNEWPFLEQRCWGHKSIANTTNINDKLVNEYHLACLL